MSRSQKGRGRAPRPEEPRYTIRCYSLNDLSAILGIPARCILSWANAGSIPSPFGHGTAALWTADDLDTIRRGLALPGTYLTARGPMLAARVAELRAEAARRRAAAGRAGPGRGRRTAPPMGKGVRS